MYYSECACEYCKNVFLKDIRRYNESIKNRWKLYCSKKCLISDKKRDVQLQCSNSNCNKIFVRNCADAKKSTIHYCSRFCGLEVNNAKRRKVEKTCPECSAAFIGRRKYCSASCVKVITKKVLVIEEKTIIEEIQTFYKKHKRIPFKNEYKHCRAARERFGTWNNAIIAAGYEPNPVKFAHKHIANDGHLCDSMSEKIIDDWLYRKKIPHEIHVSYHKNNMSADFRIGDLFVEFIGLNGQHKAYDRQYAHKKQFWIENKLNVIEIYPKDLFPKNNLQTILGELYNSI